MSKYKKGNIVKIKKEFTTKPEQLIIITGVIGEKQYIGRILDSSDSDQDLTHSLFPGRTEYVIMEDMIERAINVNEDSDQKKLLDNCIKAYSLLTNGAIISPDTDFSKVEQLHKNLYWSKETMQKDIIQILQENTNLETLQEAIFKYFNLFEKTEKSQVIKPTRSAETSGKAESTIKHVVPSENFKIQVFTDPSLKLRIEDLSTLKEIIQKVNGTERLFE